MEVTDKIKEDKKKGGGYLFEARKIFQRLTGYQHS